MKAIVTVAMIAGALLLHAGGGVVVAPTEPIVIPDTPDECGCPQK